MERYGPRARVFRAHRRRSSDAGRHAITRAHVVRAAALTAVILLVAQMIVWQSQALAYRTPTPAVVAHALLRRCLTDTTATAVTADSETIDSVSPGIVYRCRRIAKGPWLMHIVAIDLTARRFWFDAVRATDHMIGRERVSDMADRLTKAGTPPLVAINADFFDLATGEIENNNVVHGVWVKGVLRSDSPHDEFDNAHTQLAVDTTGRLHIARYTLDGSALSVGRKESLVGINYRPPRDTGLVLYTPFFGARTPNDSAIQAPIDHPVDPDARPADVSGRRSNADSVVRAPSLPQLRADSARRESLAATREALELSLHAIGRRGDTLLYETTRVVAHTGGGTPIAADGAVLSATGASRDFIRALQGGKQRRVVRIVARLTPGEIPPRAVVGGWPGLVRDGVNVGALADSIEGTFPRFSAARHPRSAAALSRDGKTLFLVVVDGRRRWSVGMSLTEMANALIDIGAWNAMNFDGGGSSTLWINGEVVNFPSDPQGERAVGNAFMVFGGDKPPGAPRRPIHAPSN